MQYICIDSIMIYQRKNNLPKRSFQRTLNKWVEVSHISCQVKSSWFEHFSTLYMKEL